MAEAGVVDGRATSPALVGRDRELSLLVAAVTGPPAVVVIEGESGVGKTRLVTELRARLETAGHWFVIGGCRWIREPFPLSPIIEAVRQLGDELARTPLSPVAGALRPLLPEIAEVLPAPPPALADRAAERHRVFRALLEVLGSVGPMVLVLEDLHWSDPQTIDFLSYLLADHPPKLSLVLSYRGEEVDPAVRALLAKLPPPVSRTDLLLTPLDQSATGALAAAILAAGPVSDEFAGYLHERTSGVPFAVEEILALLRVRGALRPADPGWSHRAIAELDVPTGIRDQVLERVNRLSADARQVVEAAAVLQTPVPAPVLANSCPPSTTVNRALEEVLDSGLLVEAGDRIGFRHLLAAQAVYGALPGRRRRQLHGLAADGLATVDPSPLGQLAHHLRQAGRTEDWVVAAERAADQAIALGHDDETVRLLEEVLRHAPLDTDQLGRIATKLAQAAVEALHPGQVRNLLLTVPTGRLPRAVRAELRFWLSVLVYQAGDPARQRELCLAAVEELDDRPDLKAWAMVGLGMPVGADEIPLSEHRRWLHRALAILPKLTDEPLQVLVTGKVAMVLTTVGDPQWRQLTTQMVAQTARTPQLRQEVNAYQSVGVDACYAGHHETASQLLTAALSGAEHCQSRRLKLRSLAQLTLLDYCRGHWEGLPERAEQVIDDLAGCPAARIDAEVVAGCLALARGDLAAARHRLTEVIARAELAGGLDILPLPTAAALRLAMAGGEVDPALSDARRLLARMQAKGIWAPTARLLPALTEAIITAATPAAARSLVKHVADRLRSLDAPLGPAAVRHARGILAASAGRWRPAATHLLAAADRYQQLTCPYEAAQAREQAAGALFAAGDPDAGPQLRAALTSYQRLGATWDTDRAASTARRHKLSLPARYRGGRRGYGDQLSPREREVAQLAATGLTNQQIARRLFRSPKTVDKQLGAALRKLGLHSRRSLADHLPDRK